jgi:hypothetical protein
MSNIELTTNQRAVLELAVATEGRIEAYPAGLLGGARTSVVRGLLRNELVEPHDAGYRLTADGYAAIGVEAPPSNTGAGGSDSKAPNTAAPGNETATTALVAPSKPNRAARGDTKLATVVSLLMRPEGATIAQIMAATEWQQHSVRGFLAGAVKKKGYTTTNSKEGDGERVYRIATDNAKADAASANPQADEEE